MPDGVARSRQQFLWTRERVSWAAYDISGSGRPRLLYSWTTTDPPIPSPDDGTRAMAVDVNLWMMSGIAPKSDSITVTLKK